MRVGDYVCGCAGDADSVFVRHLHAGCVIGTVGDDFRVRVIDHGDSCCVGATYVLPGCTLRTISSEDAFKLVGEKLLRMAPVHDTQHLAVGDFVRGLDGYGHSITNSGMVVGVITAIDLDRAYPITVRVLKHRTPKYQGEIYDVRWGSVAHIGSSVPKYSSINLSLRPFKVGDYVRGIPGMGRSAPANGYMMLARVLRVDGSRMLIGILQHKKICAAHIIGLTLWVEQEYFALAMPRGCVPAKDFTIHDYEICTDCGEVFEVGDGHGYRHYDSDICPVCREEKYVACVHCGELIRKDSAYVVDDRYVCKHCYEEKYHCCTSCGEVHLTAVMTSVAGHWYCTDCKNEQFVVCDRCGDYVRREVVREFGGSFYCVDCYERKKALHYFHDHWAKLPPVFHDTRDNLPGNYASSSEHLYFGMELEMECCGGSRGNISVINALVDKDERDWYLESDGSLSNGIEVVTHPRTFESWQAFWPEFEARVLAPAREAGCDAEVCGRCGIHIHTSLDAWSGDQLLRVFALLYNRRNYDYLLTISQRERGRLDQWASLRINDIARAKVREDVSVKKNPFGTRYAALNITSNTLEIRLFNSSLRLDRVRKNLEFVYALYRYTADVNLRTSWQGLVGWIKRHSGEVANLYAFLVVKGLIKTVGALPVAVAEEEALCA